MATKYHYVDSPLFKLECTAKICEKHFKNIFQRNLSHLGITQGELCVLDTIVRSPEISQIEIARLLFKGRAHITQMLNSLEEKGLIERSNETKNRRQIRRTSLTPKGERIYKIVCECFDNKFERMTKFFEGKSDDFIEFLEEIKEIITEGEKVTFD